MSNFWYSQQSHIWYGFSWFRLPWGLQGNSCIQQLHLQAGLVDRAPGGKVEDCWIHIFRFGWEKKTNEMYSSTKKMGLGGGFKYFLFSPLFGEDF